MSVVGGKLYTMLAEQESLSGFACSSAGPRERQGSREMPRGGGGGGYPPLSAFFFQSSHVQIRCVMSAVTVTEKMPLLPTIQCSKDL